MSLGSRLAKRGRAAVNASHISIPREPLLFLYPAWTRNSSTSTQAPSSSSTPSQPTPEVNAPFFSKTFDTPGLVIPIREDPRVKGAIEKLASTLQLEEDASVFQESADGSGSVVRKIVPSHKSLLKARERQLKATKHYTFARRVIQRRSNAILGGEKLRGVRLAYQRERRVRNGLGDWDPDWRVILADLSRNTPHHEKWLDRAVTILVPETAAKELLLGVDNNMWNIANKYGTTIQLGAKDAKSIHESFIISGSKTTITRTATEILHIAPEAQLRLGVGAGVGGVLGSYRLNTSSAAVNEDGVEVGGRDGVVRYARPRPILKAQIVKAGKMFHEPAKWTKESFLDHITSLTTVTVPHQLHKLMYKDNMRHLEEVHNVLQELFHDPERESVVSQSAFHSALKFCIRTNQMPALRKLIFRMEALKISMDTETFNIMLRGCAMDDDLHNFHFILHLMLRRGIPPNAETWVAFTLTVSDLRIKLHILNRMKEFSLTRRIKTVKNIVKGLVTHEIDASLDHGQTLEAFLAHMDTRYGRSWLTNTAGNRVLHSLALRGMVSRCWDFLLVMASREHCMPDIISINTILNHLKQEKNINGAIELLRNIPPSWGIVLDEATYHILFEMAWRARRYNLAKVVWKYACMAGCVPWRMKNRVLTSLQNNSKRWWNYSTDRISPRTVWDETAGQFLVRRDILGHPILIFERELRKKFGPDVTEKKHAGAASASNIGTISKDHNKHSQKHTYSLERPLLTPASILKGGKEGYMKPNITNYAQLMFDYFLLDQKLLHYFVPVVPFADMLAKAWEQDQRWKEVLNEKKWTWKQIEKQERRIMVPVTSCVQHLKMRSETKIIWENGKPKTVSKQKTFRL